MQKQSKGTIILNEVKSMLPYFIKHKNLWTSYEEETDTLYMHFKKPNHVDNSEMTEDDIIVRYENNELIGLTILNASSR